MLTRRRCLKKDVKWICQGSCSISPRLPRASCQDFLPLVGGWRECLQPLYNLIPRCRLTIRKILVPYILECIGLIRIAKLTWDFGYEVTALNTTRKIDIRFSWHFKHCKFAKNTHTTATKAVYLCAFILTPLMNIKIILLSLNQIFIISLSEKVQLNNAPFRVNWHQLP